jgi:hypothetical protein
MSGSAQRLQNLSYMIQSRRLFTSILWISVTKYVSCVGQLSLRGPGRHVIKVYMLSIKLTVSCDEYFFEGHKNHNSYRKYHTVLI